MLWEDEEESLDFREGAYPEPPMPKQTMLGRLESFLSGLECGEYATSEVVGFLDRVLALSPPVPRPSSDMLPEDYMVLLRSTASLNRMRDLLGLLRKSVVEDDLDMARRLLRDAAANYVLFEALFLTME